MILVLLILMLLPVLGGLAATLLPAFGILPALGRSTPSLEAWRELVAWPGFSRSIALTLFTGATATLLSLAAALAVAVLARRARVLRLAQAALPPLLATPHVALAIGLAFLIAPGGWIARLLSPWLTGWTSPPDLATVQDPYGLALVAGLCLKEAPFLLLVTLAALGQSDAVAARRVAAGLGYGPWRGSVLVVLPRIWPQIRLPALAVLAFSLSVVDVGIVLGPQEPPTLAVQVLRWFSDPDLTRWFPAAAGAVLLIVIVSGAALLLQGAAFLLGTMARRAARSGRRGGDGTVPDATAATAGCCIGGVSGLGLLGLAIWSFAGIWRFPQSLPERWTTANWIAHAAGLGGGAWTTLWLGAAATALAVPLAVACLEQERRRGVAPRRWTLTLYVPLVVPQIAFLFGMQIALVRLRLDGGIFALVWAHLVFVLPYVFLALADPWRALDPRLLRTAACLGASPWRVLWRVSLPLLLRPLLAAAAAGFAVSAGLYLPTLFAGAGRWETLTTAAVTLSSGGDRRVVAATALLQALLPLCAFAAALAIPALAARRRSALAIAA